MGPGHGAQTPFWRGRMAAGLVGALCVDGEEAGRGAGAHAEVL